MFDERKVFVKPVQLWKECLMQDQLWSLLPEEIKFLTSLNSFKKVLKNWTCDKCPCRLCETYIQNIGFVKICPSI